MTKLALTLFNMVEDTRIVLGPFDNVQVTYGIIRPFVGSTYTLRELLPDEENFYTYKRRRYSDFRVEPFDVSKHKGIEMIGADSPRDLEVVDIIDKLKGLSGDGLDGETMQYILEAVNMDEQMLSQLVKSANNLGQVEDFIVEARDIRGDKVASPSKRLLFIQDDIVEIRKVIESNGYNIYDMDAEGTATIGTLLNNIEIACDLNDDEANGWKTNRKELSENIRIVTCELCNFEFTLTKANTFNDRLGKHTVCPRCTSSFNIS